MDWPAFITRYSTYLSEALQFLYQTVILQVREFSGHICQNSWGRNGVHMWATSLVLISTGAVMLLFYE